MDLDGACDVILGVTVSPQVPAWSPGRLGLRVPGHGSLCWKTKT